MTDNNEITAVTIRNPDEVTVRDSVIVVVDGGDRMFTQEQLGLDFEQSNDVEVFEAVNRILAEEDELHITRYGS